MGLLVGDVFRHAAEVSPRGLAASLGPAELTFAELDERANRVARALGAAGVQAGDRVVWWGETSLDALPLFAAVAKCGAVFAPVNPRLAAEEADEVLGYARPRLIVHGDAHQQIDGSVAIERLLHDAQQESTADVRAPWLDERDPHVIFFTSGSTGHPKGVVLSHRVNCLRSQPGLTAEPDSGTVCMFPLFHMAGWSIALGCWQARRPVHLVPTPDAPTLLDTAARRRASRLYAIPAVWARMLDHGIDANMFGTLREADTGTSATPPELVAAIRAALPHTVTRIFYGSTEAGPGTLLGHNELETKPGSVGRPQPGVSVKLTQSSEVCIRSEMLMDGYFDDPASTAGAIDAEGWYHSGDLGVLDHDGFLSIVGRARDVIRTGGETVAPLEVERALSEHPAIAEVAVVGIPDRHWGEIVCAVVVARPGGALDLAALRGYCDGRLAAYKHPRRLELVAELPRTPATGQVQRTLVVERVTAGLPTTPRG